MAEIRISKLLKQFNIGLGDLVEFLRKKGVEVDENPNAKVSDEYLPELQKQFGKDKEAMEQAALVDIKVKEILEKTNRKQARQEEEEEEEELTIKSTTFFNPRKPKEEERVQEETPTEQEQAETPVEIAAEPVQSEPEQIVEEIPVEEVPAAGPTLTLRDES